MLLAPAGPGKIELLAVDANRVGPISKGQRIHKARVLHADCSGYRQRRAGRVRAEVDVPGPKRKGFLVFRQSGQYRFDRSRVRHGKQNILRHNAELSVEQAGVHQTAVHTERAHLDRIGRVCDRKHYGPCLRCAAPDAVLVIGGIRPEHSDPILPEIEPFAPAVSSARHLGIGKQLTC